MASMPSPRPTVEQAPVSARKGEERPPATESTHKDRVRASLEWALEEYAGTLAKLAK